MPDTTLTINHAGGGSETYTINRDKFEGIRNMTVDGATVSVDHTPADDLRNLLVDAENITINRDEGEEIRTLFIDGVEVTIDRTGEVIVEGFLTLFPNAAAAYSLQRLNGHQALINARRGSDNVEVDVYPDRTNNREVSASSPITVTSGSSSATTFGEFLTEGGNHDAFVTTWYDQAGSNHASQSIDDAQPKIAEAGSVLADGIEFNSTDNFLSLTNAVSFVNLPLSMFSVQDAQPTHNHPTLGCPNSRGVGFSGNTVQYYLTGSSATLTFDSTISGLNLYSAIHDGTTDADNITAHRNGVANSSSSGGGMGQLHSSTVWSNIGVRANTSDFFHGTIKELIIYNSDQSANREAIEANINERHSIY